MGKAELTCQLLGYCQLPSSKRRGYRSNRQRTLAQRLVSDHCDQRTVHTAGESGYD